MSITDRPNVQPWQRVNPRQRTELVLAIVLPSIISYLLVLAFQVEYTIAMVLLFLPLQLVAASIVGFRRFSRRGIGDGMLIVFITFLASFVLVLLLSVLQSLFVYGSKAVSWTFLTQNNVYISNTTGLDFGGVGHAVIGTLLIVGLTTLIAVPLGIAMAIYLTQGQSKLRGLVRTLTQALSGLPSVVSGLFILSIAITFQWERSGLLGSLALFPLMLPTVARVAEEALKLVPVDLRYAALALGAPNYRAFFQVILPAAKSGLVTAALLGVARIIGETAPLLLTVPINNGTSGNIFSGNIMTLPAYVYGYLVSNFQQSRDRAWGGALVLMAIVLIVFTSARMVSRSKSLKSKPIKQKASK
jgi:phosphate transport system permease protein